MTTTYFFDEKFAINKNTEIYAQNTTTIDNSSYDYIITLQGSLDGLFNNHSYIQNSTNPNQVDITLALNTTAFNTRYNTTIMTNGSDALTYGIESDLDFNTRVLEILALKIFGHARARAAISNDTTIIDGIQLNLSNHLNSIFETHKHDIFNQYIQTDNPNINTNDINNPVTFNFSDDFLAFPGYIAGQLNTPGLSASLNNGPTGGSALVNGTYNIPILIKIG